MERYDAETIAQLIAEGALEDQRLEFKRGRPDRWEAEGVKGDNKKADRARLEFLKDVSGMANATGGVILYGVSEDSAHALGFDDWGDLDGAMIRLRQHLHRYLDPPLDVTMYPVHVRDEAIAFVLDIPASWARPHMVTYKDGRGFYRRQGTQVRAMERWEIEQQMIHTHHLAREIDTWRTERARYVASKPLSPDIHPILMQLVPLQARLSGIRLDLREAEVDPVLKKAFSYAHGLTMHDAEGFTKR